jgi:serine/threonine-protein kinase
MREPDWSALPLEVPAQIRTLLRRCLQKEPGRRLHHVADVRVELEDALTEPSAPVSAIAPQVGALTSWMRALPWTVAALALGVAAWTLWSRPGLPTSAGQSVLRLEISLPAGVELFTASPRPVAISPDGTRLAFVGVRGGSRQVYVRPLDQFEAVPLRGTDTVSACFFSPDGQSIGFVTSTGLLKTLSLVDGLVATVTEGANPSGAAWSADDRIVFARDGALWQVPRSGGTPQALTRLGGAPRDTLHAWPVVLPDGKTMLFGAASGDERRIEALVLATGERRIVVENGTLPLYATSGYLVFVRDGELLAAPFDAVRLELTGPAVRAVENLPASPSGVPMVDVSSSGTVVYAPTTAVSAWSGCHGRAPSSRSTTCRARTRIRALRRTAIALLSKRATCGFRT